LPLIGAAYTLLIIIIETGDTSKSGRRRVDRVLSERIPVWKAFIPTIWCRKGIRGYM